MKDEKHKKGYSTSHMKMTANNNKKVGSKLAKYGGEVRVREISNGWIVKEEWKEMKSGKKMVKDMDMDMNYGDYTHKSEETYYEKNPFA